MYEKHKKHLTLTNKTLWEDLERKEKSNEEDKKIKTYIIDFFFVALLISIALNLYQGMS